jgi:hypothetical protein
MAGKCSAPAGVPALSVRLERASRHPSVEVSAPSKITSIRFAAVLNLGISGATIAGRVSSASRSGG